MSKKIITKTEAGTYCPDCPAGAMFSVPVSRLEESLGHRVYECDKCHVRYKFVNGVFLDTRLVAV